MVVQSVLRALFIVLTRKAIREILREGSCGLLDDLDDIGEHFRKSWRTRTTGHKMHDFSSLQARSSMNLQQFYKNMRSAYDKYLETVSPLTSSSQGPVLLKQLPNNNLKKNLERYEKKIDRAKEKLVRSINSNPKLRDKILGELKKPSEDVENLVKSAADDVFLRWILQLSL